MQMNFLGGCILLYGKQWKIVERLWVDMLLQVYRYFDLKFHVSALIYFYNVSSLRLAESNSETEKVIRLYLRRTVIADLMIISM